MNFFSRALSFLANGSLFTTSTVSADDVYHDGLRLAKTGALVVSGSGITVGDPVVSGTAGSILYVAAGPVLAQSTGLTFGSAAGTVTAGAGLQVAAGTAASAVSALSITQTWNYNAAALTGVQWTFTDTSSHASTLAFQILGGAAGTTNLLSLSKVGALGVGTGTEAAPALTLSSQTASGFYGISTSNWVWAAGGYSYILINGNFKIATGSTFQWGTGDANSALGSGISQISAGLLAVGTGAAGSFAGRLKLTSTIKSAVAVGSLNASPTIGEVQTVNDALAVAAKGATVAAGGTAVCQVMWNGSAWVGI